MTTVEKLFVQIFERKNWIIEQVKQQTELYDQHLASKLLIDGITPPAWLWNPKFYSDASYPDELKKEELISELLLPRVQSTVPYSGGCCSLYNKAVVTGNNGVLSEGLFMENHASNKGFEAGEGLTAMPECQDVDVGHALNHVPELDFSTTSPQEQMDGGISNIYTAPDLSFARIQRSKSRQKALELRNSAKAVAKSHHHHVNNAGVSSSGFTASRIASLQPHQGNEFLELAKLSDISSGSCEVREAKEDCLGKGEGTNVYSGRITRSKSISLEYTSTSASKQPDHVDEHLELAKSCHSKDCCMGEAKVDSLSKEKGTDNCSRSNLGAGLEVAISSPPLDQNMVVNPRQHGYDDFEGSSLNETLSPMLGKKKLDTSLEEANLMEHTESVNKLTSDNPDRKSLEKQSLVDRELSNKAGEAQRLFSEAHVEECTTVKSNVNENSMLINVDNTLEAALKIQHSSVSRELIASLNKLTSDNSDGKFSEKESLVDREVSDKAEEACGVSFEDHVEECSSLKKLTSDNTDRKFSEKESLVDREVSNKSEEAHRVSFEAHVEECTGMQDSWPQFKRRKIEGQQTNFFSASPSFRMQKLNRIEGGSIHRDLKSAEGDAVAVQKFQNFPVIHEGEISRSIFYDHPDVEMHQKGKCFTQEQTEPSPKLGLEKEELSSEERAKFTNTPSTYKHRQFGQSVASGFAKHVAGDSQDCLIEKVITEDQTNFVLDIRRACDEQDFNCLSHFENKVHLGNMDDFMSTDTTLLERPHLGEDCLFSYGLGVSPPNKSLDFGGADQTWPVFEGFIVDVQRENGQPHIPGYDISFDKLDLQNTTIERASVLEQLCKSSVMHTPFSQCSSIMKLHKTPDLYQSVSNGILENVDLGSNLPLNDDGSRQPRASYSCVNEFKCAFEGVSYSDCLPYPNACFGQNSGKTCASPVGKFWERITSGSSSSEKNRSLNPELTCFPIEEDHSISEGDENNDDMVDTIQDTTSSIAVNDCSKREPLVEITEPYSNAPAPVSVAKKFPDSGSLDSISTDSVTHSRVKQKLGNHNSNKRRCMNEAKENHSLSVGINGTNKVTESLHNRFSKPKLSGKISLRKGVQLLSERGTKNNNIVSNIISFVPLVQQKQAAVVGPGKRDIKVKALEAAEAARRLEEKKENERKMKKEAMKLERARLEEENLRQMELKRKKKEEEQKKKYADMAARKRQRVEEERKEKEKKRKRVEEAQRQQREQEEKLHVGKVEKELQFGIMDEKVSSGKESNNESRKHCKMEKESGDDNTTKKPETQLQTAGVSSSHFRQASTVTEGCEISSDYFETGKAMMASDKSTLTTNLVTKTSQEKSYEISPYQCSDDEEEDVDEIPSRKFIPSWASRNCVALVLSSQQKIDPDVIFPQASFCRMDEVLLPRKIQPK